jgi:hypothetical protein
MTWPPRPRAHDSDDARVHACTRAAADVAFVFVSGRRAFLGSVSDYCAHHASCPIMVVKPLRDGGGGDGDAGHQTASWSPARGMEETEGHAGESLTHGGRDSSARSVTAVATLFMSTGTQRFATANTLFAVAEYSLHTGIR